MRCEAEAYGTLAALEGPRMWAGMVVNLPFNRERAV